MKLSLKEAYSIFKPFDVELPDFTIITGLNGAGKSQFLQAIDDKKIEIIIKDNKPLSNIKLYKYENENKSWKPGNSNSSSSGEDIRRSIQGIYDSYIVAKNGAIPQNKSIEEVIASSQSYNLKWVLNIVAKSEKSISELTFNDFVQHIPIEFVNSHNYIGHNFANLFMLYVYKRDHNEYIRFLSEVRGRIDVKYYTEQKFIDHFGPPPWELVNKVFEAYKSEYRVTSPSAIDKEGNFNLLFESTISGEKIGLDDLSSGEKVMMALILAIYNAKNGLDNFPQLILMDEPDAPLHPSMTKIFLEIIQSAFIDSLKMKVIMTTHSPTTVALAEKESLYIMEKTENGSRKLRSIQKDDALKLLTEDIPFLSVDYKKTKFVVVEGPTDIMFYPKVYEKLRFQDYLDDKVSLIFMPSGSLHKGGNSYAVQQVVKAFNDNSGEDISMYYGIIDRDKNNKEEGNIKVLGKDRRYSLENYIFDPLYLALFWLEQKYITKKELGLSDNENFWNHDFDKTRLQNISDIIINKLEFDDDDKQDNNYVVVTYLNNHIVKIPKWYLEYNWHKNNDNMVKKISKLHFYTGGTLNDFKESIIVMVMNTAPQLISSDILELLREIQEHQG